MAVPTLTIHVLDPSDPDPRDFTWPQTMKVGAAAREASEAFGHQAGNPTFRRRDGHLLDRDKPLVAEHVKDGDTLELVDVAGGV